MTLRLGEEGGGVMYDYAPEDPPEYIAQHGDAIRRLRVESGVTKVGAYAFAGCSALAKVTLPEGLEAVGEGAFQDCAALRSVYLPEGLAVLRRGLFRNCAALEEVFVPNSADSIYSQAFAGCARLRSVRIPLLIQYIDKTAFQGAAYDKEGRLTAAQRGRPERDAAVFPRALAPGSVLFFLDEEGRPLREKAALLPAGKTEEGEAHET